MTKYLSALLWFTLIGITAVGKDGPIPQDPEREQQRRRDNLAWHERTLAGAYDKIGKKDPRWDKSAQEALAAAARFFSYQIDPLAGLKTFTRRPARRSMPVAMTRSSSISTPARLTSQTIRANLRRSAALPRRRPPCKPANIPYSAG